MHNKIANPDELFKLSPEALEFTQCYLSCLDIKETAEMMEIPQEEAAQFLRKPEVKRMCDTIFLEQGYTNRFKLKGVLEKVIESKIEEAEESGVYTSKDLLDVLKLMHDIRKDEIKMLEAENTKPSVQKNTQINNYGGDNLANLISSLVEEK